MRSPAEQEGEQSKPYTYSKATAISSRKTYESNEGIFKGLAIAGPPAQGRGRLLTHVFG